MVGKIYYWMDAPVFMKDKINRCFKVLSVTLTHVYIKNVRTGYSYNVSLDNFNKNYVLVDKED